MGPRWYVLRVEPRAEHLADEALCHDGFQTFSPRIKTPSHRLGRVDEPLFPGYLFLRLDPDSNGWPSFRTAHRVVGLVNFGGIVPPVPDETIAELTTRVNEVNGTQGMWRRFKLGEIVRVVSGAIDSLGEVVEEAQSPQGRARVLMGFMGSQIPVQVPWGDIRSVQDQPKETQSAPRRTRGRYRWIRGFGPAAVA